MAEKKISVAVYNTAGEETSKLSLKSSIWGIEPNTQVIYDAVKLYMANSRQATAKTKKRFEVSGGGKKPWRQKGTGRARAGSTRSPIWVGGGTVFGPTGVQNFKIEQNRKSYDLALRSSLSLKAKDGLKVVETLEIKEKKTKALKAILNALKVDGKCLIVVKEANEELVASCANIPTAAVLTPDQLAVYDIIDAKYILATKDAIKVIEEELA